ICIYLADRYGYGTLAPKIDDLDRGPYLRWMVFATAVFEPAVYIFGEPGTPEARSQGWGDTPTVYRILDELFSNGPWILGERFSAADVMLGSLLSIALFNQRLPQTPPVKAYNDRISARPAYQRAANF